MSAVYLEAMLNNEEHESLLRIFAGKYINLEGLVNNTTLYSR